ncbi:MAG: DNA repair protein RecN [Acidithiobacillus sp.]|nr:DNA repair protein RecN [Acidithiobacillus sp.]
MLLELVIRDFALIQQLQLQWQSGLTVLTGETGAGKSIIIDAIALLLGGKGRPQLVRHGCQQAEISGTFQIDADLRQWLADQGLPGEEEVILRRLLPADGRSRFFLDGRPISATQAKELGERLVDILGQHAHLQLLREDRQLALLDRFLANPKEQEELRQAWHSWRAAQREYQQELEAAARRQNQDQWRRFLWEELRAAALRPGEWEELQREHRLLGAVEQISAAMTQALQALEGELGAQQRLAEAQRVLQSVANKDEQLTEPLTLLESSEIQIHETIDQLRHHFRSLPSDPERLQQVSQRLDQLQDLQRKHRQDMAGLLALEQELATEFAQESQTGDALHRSASHLAETRQQYVALASRQSQLRLRQAPLLASALQEQIRTLGMEHALVELRLQSFPDSENGWTGSGWDQADFWITVNPGHPAQAMTAVASGGELARISLALHVLLQWEGVDTLIFDEVDVGVGGAVAERIGKLLRALGKRRQILCITHLPQVAAQGHHHFLVEKQIQEGQTSSTIRLLSSEERVEELSRMLGGSQIHGSLRSAAQKLLSAASTDSV